MTAKRILFLDRYPRNTAFYGLIQLILKTGMVLIPTLGVHHTLRRGWGLGVPKAPEPGEKMGKGVGSARKRKEKVVEKEGGRRKERKMKGINQKNGSMLKRGTAF